MVFVRKIWQFRDIISENELNRMEDGIEEGITKAEQAQGDISAHVARTDNPHGVTKNQVGLGSVQNYPVASQSEAEAGTASNRYMTPQRTKQAIDALSPVKSVNGKTGAVSLGKGDVGLGNVDNVKQATKTEFDAHANNTNNPHGVTKAQVGLGNVDNMSATSIRTDSGRALRVEVVSSSASESPDAGRIIFDTSEGKFFGGNGAEWV